MTPSRIVSPLLTLPAILCWCACAAGPAEPSRPESRPSILLVTIDTLRADRLGPDGPMPQLRRLAGRGALFRRAHTQVPLTLPSHTSILTGRGVRGHGVRDNIGYALGDRIPTVAEDLSAAGYATAAFVGGYPLVRSFGLARGFATYDDRMTREPPGVRAGHTERRAEEVVDAVTEWFHKRPDKPFFVWVHLFDPHDPYDAPAPFAGRHDQAYDDEAAYTDHHLGRLVDTIRDAAGGKVWTLVVADHGEALGEHGETTHGIFLYEPVLHVPLVVVPPEPPATQTIDAPVSLLDLAPTLRDVAGLPSASDGDGRSLVPLLRGDPVTAGGPLYLESIHGRRMYGWAPLTGLLDWPRKFVSAPRPELYDLERDPREENNLATRTDLGPFESRLGEIRGAPAPDARRTVSTPELERLSALGYVGAVTTSEADDSERPDPKDRIAALPEIETGLAALAAGDDQRARTALRRARELDPDNLVVLNNLGILAMRAGDVDHAAELFALGLLRDDHSEQLANNLGIARSRQGRQLDAAAAFRRALEIRPGFTGARFNLALALYRQGRREEALTELERVRVEQPDFPELAATIETIRTAEP